MLLVNLLQMHLLNEKDDCSQSECLP
jgi:hypothetical protein